MAPGSVRGSAAASLRMASKSKIPQLTETDDISVDVLRSLRSLQRVQADPKRFRRVMVELKDIRRANGRPRSDGTPTLPSSSETSSSPESSTAHPIPAVNLTTTTATTTATTAARGGTAHAPHQSPASSTTTPVFPSTHEAAHRRRTPTNPSSASSADRQEERAGISPHPSGLRQSSHTHGQDGSLSPPPDGTTCPSSFQSSAYPHHQSQPSPTTASQQIPSDPNHSGPWGVVPTSARQVLLADATARLSVASSHASEDASSVTSSSGAGGGPDSQGFGSPGWRSEVGDHRAGSVLSTSTVGRDSTIGPAGFRSLRHSTSMPLFSGPIRNAIMWTTSSNSASPSVTASPKSTAAAPPRVLGGGASASEPPSPLVPSPFFPTPSHSRSRRSTPPPRLLHFTAATAAATHHSRRHPQSMGADVESSIPSAAATDGSTTARHQRSPSSTGSVPGGPTSPTSLSTAAAFNRSIPLHAFPIVRAAMPKAFSALLGRSLPADSITAARESRSPLAQSTRTASNTSTRGSVSHRAVQPQAAAYDLDYPGRAYTTSGVPEHHHHPHGAERRRQSPSADTSDLATPYCYQLQRDPTQQRRAARRESDARDDVAAAAAFVSAVGSRSQHHHSLAAPHTNVSPSSSSSAYLPTAAAGTSAGLLLQQVHSPASANPNNAADTSDDPSAADLLPALPTCPMPTTPDLVAPSSDQQEHLLGRGDLLSPRQPEQHCLGYSVSNQLSAHRSQRSAPRRRRATSDDEIRQSGPMVLQLVESEILKKVKSQPTKPSHPVRAFSAVTPTDISTLSGAMQHVERSACCIVDEAVVTIQRYWRGHLGRILGQRMRAKKQFLETRVAYLTPYVVTLQRAYRNWKLNLLARQKIISYGISAKREKAAITIQRIYRGHTARVHAEFERLVRAIMDLRRIAAIKIQKTWRGYRTRAILDEEFSHWVIKWVWDPPTSVIEVVGDFTDPPWRSRQLMKYCNVRGYFTLSLPRILGYHEIKFIVNGSYLCDGSETVVSDKAGHLNNMVRVDQAATTTPFQTMRARLARATARRNELVLRRRMLDAGGPMHHGAQSPPRENLLLPPFTDEDQSGDAAAEARRVVSSRTATADRTANSGSRHRRHHHGGSRRSGEAVAADSGTHHHRHRHHHQHHHSHREHERQNYQDRPLQFPPSVGGGSAQGVVDFSGNGGVSTIVQQIPPLGVALEVPFDSGMGQMYHGDDHRHAAGDNGEAALQEVEHVVSVVGTTLTEEVVVCASLDARTAPLVEGFEISTLENDHKLVAANKDDEDRKIVEGVGRGHVGEAGDGRVVADLATESVRKSASGRHVSLFEDPALIESEMYYHLEGQQQQRHPTGNNNSKGVDDDGGDCHFAVEAATEATYTSGADFTGRADPPVIMNEAAMEESVLRMDGSATEFPSATTVLTSGPEGKLGKGNEEDDPKHQHPLGFDDVQSTIGGDTTTNAAEELTAAEDFLVSPDAPDWTLPVTPRLERRLSESGGSPKIQTTYHSHNDDDDDDDARHGFDDGGDRHSGRQAAAGNSGGRNDSSNTPKRDGAWLEASAPAATAQLSSSPSPDGGAKDALELQATDTSSSDAALGSGGFLSAPEDAPLSPGGSPSRQPTAAAKAHHSTRRGGGRGRRRAGRR